MGCHSLLLRIYRIPGSNLGLPPCSQILYPLSQPPGKPNSLWEWYQLDGVEPTAEKQLWEYTQFGRAVISREPSGELYTNQPLRSLHTAGFSSVTSELLHAIKRPAIVKLKNPFQNNLNFSFDSLAFFFSYFHLDFMRKNFRTTSNGIRKIKRIRKICPYARTSPTFLFSCFLPVFTNTMCIFAQLNNDSTNI